MDDEHLLPPWSARDAARSGDERIVVVFDEDLGIITGVVDLAGDVIMTMLG